MSDRTTKQIARDALRAAKEAGVVEAYSVREGGRATIYPADKQQGKYYTTSTLDTLAVLKQIGFQP